MLLWNKDLTESGIPEHLRIFIEENKERKCMKSEITVFIGVIHISIFTFYTHLSIFNRQIELTEKINEQILIKIYKK